MRAPGRVRIIAGRLRGSRLDVPVFPGLRPTPDRLRETLFNWLAPYIEGARCLDLFAGTGALGIEALSRGAGDTLFIERDTALAQALRANLARLKLDAIVHQASALAWLGGTPRAFDLVFLDPPFDDLLWRPVLAGLDRPGWLAANALIYMESPRELTIDAGPGWVLQREACVGAVRGALYRRAAALG